MKRHEAQGRYLNRLEKFRETSELSEGWESLYAEMGRRDETLGKEERQLIGVQRRLPGNSNPCEG